MKIKTNDNKKLLIILGGLMVLGIGISFAYFLNSGGIFGIGSKTSATTAIIGSSNIKVEGTLSFDDKDILPGHKNISAIKLTATGNNELVSYNLIWKGINTLNTPLNYTVYKTTSKIETKANCEKVTIVENGKQYLSEECSISNAVNLGGAIARGTIETSTSEAKVMLVKDEMITATSDGDVKYYYIVLEYPNLDANQNIDMGGSFEGKLTVEKGNNKPDVNIMAVYIKEPDASDYTKVDDLPVKDLKVSFNTSKSSCTNNATPIWNGDSWNITIDNLMKSGTSCYLYFDKTNEVTIPSGTTSATLLNYVDNKLSGTPEFDGIEGNGLYTWSSGDYSNGSKSIQYFRGNVNNNWVVFGKDGDQYIWWRIIRNNSNGSLRMIYSGTSTNKTSAPLMSSILISRNKAYNENYDNNMYVGFKYTENHLHGTGTETSQTIYAAYNRLYTNKAPSLLCTNVDDIFKTPRGLITADEVNMAGMGYSSSLKNTSSYLHTNSNYWTMSPYDFNKNAYANVFYVSSDGYLNSMRLDRTNPGVRPVINLKADTLFEAGGNGTSTSPYVVQGT